ncbi:class I SAM-dependent methyltransferase [Desulfovibrio sp. TomC]|uniref:class I SAM-dependent methyltransferase n=1 Tax=Desulfovibrio sp. TomC TaxID=1562888 RepID=UPI000573B689|nr:class I SAM-dependent methyltransferase [Desulfovibrio sp. TomC]KHK02832.1 putative methyltransferase protein [Desulfovibrio sp. TomC]
MESRHEPLAGYYRLHARVYDATRWSFLFGRSQLVAQCAQALAEMGKATGARVAEVGCGTGHNLRLLARELPTARLTGIDLCPPMLRRAAKAVGRTADRVELACCAYGPDSLARGSMDLIVFSYALSMFNPGFEAALDAARLQLRPGGLVAVVDFCDTSVPWFRSWMGVNHVRMDGHLLPQLADRFVPARQKITPAYGGLWRRFSFLGHK